VDPICTFVFGTLVMFTTVKLARQCVHILLDASPAAAQLSELATDIESSPGLSPLFLVFS
jgi:Co/Zn/Cd efflux system component